MKDYRTQLLVVKYKLQEEKYIGAYTLLCNILEQMEEEVENN